MRRLWRNLGIAAFWLSWPALWIWISNSERSRVMLVHDGKILVVKGWYGDGKWTLPGGGKHVSESPLQAAQRELYEELGISLTDNDLKPILSEHLKINGMPHTLHYFIAEFKRKPAIHRRSSEISHAEWLQPSELNKKTANASVIHALDSLKFR